MSEYVKLVTPVFRVQYPNVFTPRPPKPGKEPLFGVMSIWTPSEFSAKDKQRWKALRAAMDEALMAAFKVTMKEAPRSFKLGLRDGAEKTDDVEGCGPGTVFANLTTKFAPGVVNLQKEEISLEEGNDDEFFAGVLARATVNVYTFNTESKGIALGLQNLQLVKDDGTRFKTGRSNAADDFADDIGDADDGEEDTGFLD